jgi:phosphatidylserine/phosphatidylglycerophosphate/cardiolipin synthase-like enzyme
MICSKIIFRIPSIEKKLDGKTRGIIHSKIIVADKYGRFDKKLIYLAESSVWKNANFRKHFYIGSANLGSRGASWTKEVGVLVTNCPDLGVDASKLVQLYWELGNLKDVPKK